MSFWTFLDRNGFGVAVFLLLVGSLAVNAYTGHRGDGCRVRCGTGEVAIRVADGGAP